MVKLTFIWEDDKNKSVIQMKEPEATEDTMALIYDDFDSCGYLPFDAFKRLLKSVGYHDYTIGKYLVDGAISFCLSESSSKEAIKVIKDMLIEYGIYDEIIKEEEEEEN